MQLPDPVKAIRSRYVAKFPIPQGPAGDQHEENCRQWSIRFAEQVAYEQGPSWGMKRADPGRPISKDTIAYSEEGPFSGAPIRIWDLLTGTGTGNPRLNEDPQSEDITGQVFVPVTPTNHLGAPAPTPQPTPTPSVDLSAILQKFDTLAGQVDALVKIAASLDEKMDTLNQRFQTSTADFATIGKALDGITAQIANQPAPTQPIAYSGAFSFRQIRLTPEY